MLELGASPYERIEVSDPALELHGLRFLTFYSPALGRRGDVTLWCPEQLDGRRDAPLVVLLHGVYCSHWAWAFKAGAHLTASRLLASGAIPPLVLAMPSDGLWDEGSGYVPHNGADYERWIVDDVVGCVTEVVPALGPASPRFIAGLSMGGYGALRFFGKYRNRFQSASAHSSVTHLADLAQYLKAGRLPSRPSPTDDGSVLQWLSLLEGQPRPFRFDCGLDDHFIEQNRALHRELEARGIAHLYQEFDGGHTWEYWRTHLEDTLLFFADQLNRTKP